MTQETELKPCPFCGGIAKKMPMKDGRFAIGCSNHCNMLAELTDRAAIKAWNTRAEDPTKAELIEVLEELAVLMQDIIDGEYKPDSFTLQPAKAILEKAKGER